MSNQEVKVGQVWVGKYSGIEYKVTSMHARSVELSWGNGDKNTGSESIDNLINSGSYLLKIDTSETEEFIKEMSESSPFVKKLFGRGNYPQETIELRDHFAGLAMNRLVSEWSDVMRDEMAKQAYLVADAMLKARGE